MANNSNRINPRRIHPRISLLRQRPVQVSHANERDGGSRVAPIPDRIGPGGGVPPSHIGQAITVVVAHPGDLPVQIRNIDDVDGCADRIARIPDRIGPGGVVPPQNIILAVPIEVGHPGHLPALVRDVDGGDLGGAVAAIPDRIGAGAEVSPQHIVLAIAIEVANARDLPVQVRHIDDGDGCTAGGAGVPDRI